MIDNTLVQILIILLRNIYDNAELLLLLLYVLWVLRLGPSLYTLEELSAAVLCDVQQLEH